jgi:hypothetical protein
MTIKISPLHTPSLLPPFEAVPWNDLATICPCCDGEAHLIFGGILAQNQIRAVYFVSWTRDRPQHVPHIDLILGPWGHDSQASARVLVTLAYRPHPQGGGFVQIDSEKRLANSPVYCGRALAATEAIPPPFALELPRLIEAICQSHPSINETLRSDTDNFGAAPE